MKNIVVTGSTNWQDRVKLKNTLFELKNRVGDGLRIISGGFALGTDLYVKKFTRDLDIDYAEIPPYNYQWNHYCIEPSYKFGNQFDKRYIFMRNELLAKSSDLFVIFWVESDEYKVYYEDLANRAIKKDKKVIIVE